MRRLILLSAIEHMRVQLGWPPHPSLAQADWVAVELAYIPYDRAWRRRYE